MDSAALQHARDVKGRHADRLMATPGVFGVGIGEQNGHPVIRVYVDPGFQPAETAIDDIPIEYVRSGPITAAAQGETA